MSIRIGYADKECLCQSRLVMPIKIGYGNKNWLYGLKLVMLIGYTV